MKKYDSPYPESTTVLEIPVAGSIRAKLLTNSLGKFIDFRYYQGNSPTTKGIRMHISSFLVAVGKMKMELEALAEDDDD